MSKHDDIVKLWLEDILNETGLTPSRLATEADISPSTLTRYFNPDGPLHNLSRKSMAAIARRFGRDLPDFEGHRSDERECPRPNFAEFMRQSPLADVQIELQKRHREPVRDVF